MWHQRRWAINTKCLPCAADLQPLTFKLDIIPKTSLQILNPPRDGWCVLEMQGSSGGCWGCPSLRQNQKSVQLRNLFLLVDCPHASSTCNTPGSRSPAKYFFWWHSTEVGQSTLQPALLDSPCMVFTWPPNSSWIAQHGAGGTLQKLRGLCRGALVVGHVGRDGLKQGFRNVFITHLNRNITASPPGHSHWSSLSPMSHPLSGLACLPPLSYQITS